MAIARTRQWRVVICQTGANRLYYMGLGLESGLPIEIDDPIRSGNGFVVTNEGVRYSISASALIITKGLTLLSNEPMVEYYGAVKGSAGRG